MKNRSVPFYTFYTSQGAIDVPAVCARRTRTGSPSGTAASTFAAEASPRHAATIEDPEPLIQNAQAPASRQASRQAS